MNTDKNETKQLLWRKLAVTTFSCLVCTLAHSTELYHPTIDVPTNIYPPGFLQSASFNQTASFNAAARFQSDFEPGFSQPNYGSGLWLQITNMDFYDGAADVMFHNTTNGIIYLIWLSTNLITGPWIPNQFFHGQNTNTPQAVGIDSYQWENQTLYWNNTFTYPSNLFFFATATPAAQPFIDFTYPQNTTVTYPSSPTDASQNVTNTVDYGYIGTPNTLSIPFQVLGNAVYGVDYTLQGATYTNGIATITFPLGTYQENVVVEPLYTTNATFGTASVTLSLMPGPYWTQPGASEFTVTIEPQVMPISIVTNLPDSYQDGIDYDPVQNALILSVNSPNGEPNNFIMVNTNSGGVVTITNWSNVSGVANEEVELTVVKTTTNNFVQGDMYFGDSASAGIDKLSDSGINWTVGWCVLTNSSYVDGIYIDQPGGAFNGDMVATTLNGDVWRIHCDTNGNAQPTKLVNLPLSFDSQLGGAVTLPNDPTKWGPWAGRILTGDVFAGILYGIDTNGLVISNQLGIAYESFGLIPTNQALYFIDVEASQLDKIPAAELAPYVGDLALSQTAVSSNFGSFTPPGTIFIVRWNPTTSALELRSTPEVITSIYEDLTFAPFDLPSQ